MPDAARVLAPRIIDAASAIREATVAAMEKDDRVFVMGEGATDPKGIFGTTSGLLEQFGAERVMEMPVAENGWTGIAIGAALCGQRPILVHQRVEFSLLAMEQLVNNAAKIHYVSGGKHRAPLVVRLVVGRGWGQGPAHSQSLEALFAHVPGLKVVMPSSAADAKGLLLGAIEDDGPVIVIEHRWVHYATGHVDPQPVAMPLDGPRRVRAGDDVTVVSTSYMTLETLQAADALGEAGCNVEVFDLRVLRPLRLDAIIASVRRTGRLVTVDTGHSTYGIGAEIVARVTAEAFEHLKAPPRRIGLPEHPTPSARSLAEGYYPRSPTIAATIGEVVGVAPARLAEVAERLASARDCVPLDIPHPSFKGPF
ncbi:MAG TPA: transketolase C-terminal domain-containing protein [Nannocystaceae bacterium]|nr:transketolase C-terminal domain-containing protein [Nannocystaceae bacterium]